MPELFLAERLKRIQKTAVNRYDLAHVLSSQIIEADKDLEYSDATFCANELAEAGDALQQYLKRDGAIDCEEINFALQIIDSKLKEYFDTLESALRTELVNG